MIHLIRQLFRYFQLEIKDLSLNLALQERLLAYGRFATKTPKKE